MELPKPHPSPRVFPNSPPSLISTHSISVIGQSARGRKPGWLASRQQSRCVSLFSVPSTFSMSASQPSAATDVSKDLSGDSGCFPSIENPFSELKNRKEKER